jgi:NTE family protein
MKLDNHLFNHPCIGLALGGGGARSLAHIGTLKVFEQAGIPVHRLTGSSMGGMIAAAYAFGLPLAEIETVAMRMANPRQLIRLIDFVPFRRGVVAGKHVRQFIANIFGAESAFADLHIPLALTATDLTRGQLVLLKEGSLVDAILATCTVPGLWPPVQIGNTLLVDGGFYNNLPVDITRQMGADIVIALDAAPHFPRQAINPDEESQHPLPGPVPDFVEDFYQAMMILSDLLTHKQLEDAPPDYIVRPIMADDISLLAFHRAKEIIAAGEQAARLALPKIMEICKRSNA